MSTTQTIAAARPLAEPRGSPAPELAEVRELWLALRGLPWRSLAVVPLTAGGELGRALWEVARWAGPGAVGLLDASAVGPAEVAALDAELGARAARGERVLVVTGPALAAPASLAVAQAADAVLLSVTLGDDDLASARRVIRLLGRERVVGSVVRR